MAGFILSLGRKNSTKHKRWGQSRAWPRLAVIIFDLPLLFGHILGARRDPVVARRDPQQCAD